MKSEIINSKQAIALMSLFIAGSAMISGNAAWVGRDAWISLLLAAVLTLPFVLIYARISCLFPETKFFDALFQIFGKFFGWIICMLMTVYFFQIAVMATRNFTEFVQVASLGHTPQVFIGVCLALLCGYAVSKGLSVMGRSALVLFFVVAVLVVFTVVMLIPGMDVENLLPVMSRPYEDIASGAFAYFTFPLAESVALLSILGGVRNEQSRYKLYIASLCIAVGLILTALLRNLLVFGGDIVAMMQFPSYISARIIEIGGFVQRVEAFVSGNMLICVVARLCVCIYAVSRGVSRMFGVGDYRKVAMPVALLAAALAPLMFSNAPEMTRWIRDSAVYMLPFQTALPVIIWLGAEIHTRRAGRKTDSQPGKAAAGQTPPAG